jgi:hypothetical protein
MCLVGYNEMFCCNNFVVGLVYTVLRVVAFPPVLGFFYVEEIMPWEDYT